MGNASGHAGHEALARFFVDAGAVAGDRVAFSPQQWHQIRRVLRLPESAKVVVCDGSGDELLVRLASAEARAGTVEERRHGRTEPGCRLHLYQSALRGEHFAWLLHKGTEIGVAAFTPVLYARTQPAGYGERLERYRAIVREAAEQCERSLLPRVAAPLKFGEAIAAVSEVGGTALLLDERERERSLRSVLQTMTAPVSVFVGPEGGLTVSERDAAKRLDIISVSLGRRMLRSETAGVVASSLILAATGDLG